MFQQKAFSVQATLAQTLTVIKWSNPRLLTNNIVEDRSMSRALKLRTIKFNIDGACTIDGRVVGCGGIARDHTGKFLGGFIYHIGICSSLNAELCKVLWALKRA